MKSRSSSGKAAGPTWFVAREIDVEPATRLCGRRSAGSRRNVSFCLGATAALALFLAAAHLHAQRPAVWQLAPELRFGQDGRSGYDFSRIAAILPARDGSVVISDSRNNEIVVFGRSGEYLRRIGGTGRGPGEFGRLRGIGFLADTLWVIDGAERRVSLFSLDGKNLATIRLEGEAHIAARWVPILSALLPDGRGLGFGSPSMTSGLAFRGSPEPVFLMSRSAQAIDTVAWVSTKNRYLLITHPDGSATFGEQRFGDAALVIFAPNSSSFFIVDRTAATAENDAKLGVIAVRATGDTLWSRKFAYQPRKLERSRVDSLLTAMERARRRSAVAPDEIRRAVFIPDYYPSVTSGVVSSDGSLWLRREEGKPTVDYWVIGRDGVLLSTVTVPANVIVMAASSSYVWAQVKDEFDVPTVVRYQITRSRSRGLE